MRLLVRGKECGLAGIDTLYAVTGSGVLDVVAEMGGGLSTAALDVRALENDARREITPVLSF